MAEVTIAGSNRKSAKAVYLTILVYFFWGFAAAGNALLIPIFKTTFRLSQFQAQLVELSFYMAYFLGSVIYFLFSIKCGDIINRFGAKKGMITGLCLAAAGSLIMIPAAAIVSYPLFLLGLFIIGLGFTLQQIVANPLLVQMGEPNGGAGRLLLAGSINSFGNTIAPLLLATLLFGSVKTVVDIKLDSVKIPYIILTACYLVFALMYFLIFIPKSEKNTTVEKVRFGALSYPQLRYGMIAIFCYVGAEVTLQSNLPALISSADIMGLDTNHAAHLFSLFGGSLMVGRCTGALSNLKLKRSFYFLLVVVVPFAVYGIVLLANKIKGSPMSDLYGYIPFIILIIACILLGRRNPARLLFWAAVSAISVVFLGLFFEGKLAMYCMISSAFFTSLMWPCIFSLAILNLKQHTNQASSLLVMMIVGGAIIPPLQGLISDLPFVGIHYSFFIPLLCFAYILYFSIKARTQVTIS